MCDCFSISANKDATIKAPLLQHDEQSMNRGKVEQVAHKALSGAQAPPATPQSQPPVDRSFTSSSRVTGSEEGLSLKDTSNKTSPLESPIPTSSSPQARMEPFTLDIRSSVAPQIQQPGSKQEPPTRKGLPNRKTRAPEEGIASVDRAGKKHAGPNRLNFQLPSPGSTSQQLSSPILQGSPGSQATSSTNTSREDVPDTGFLSGDSFTSE